MKTIYSSFLSILIVSLFSCNNAKKENSSQQLLTLQKLISLDDLLGLYSIRKDKLNEIDFKVVIESGKYILYNHDKNKNTLILYTEMEPISREDNKAFIRLSIFKNLLSDTGIYIDKSRGISFFKIKQGTESSISLSGNTKMPLKSLNKSNI